MTVRQIKLIAPFLAAVSLMTASLPTTVGAQSTIERLFGVTDVRTQELTPYWSEGLHTLLEIFCTDLRCQANRSDENDKYAFSLDNIELPVSEFGMESSAIVQIGEIRANISKDGLSAFNGFPTLVDFSISGITINDDGINEIANTLFADEPRMQRLIAREIAKESLSLEMSLTRDSDIDFILDFSVELLSGDRISASIAILASRPILTFLKKEEILAADLQAIDDESVRGAFLYDSIDWASLTEVPLLAFQLVLTEISLLDKIYGPFLIEKKSEKEQEFWTKVKAEVSPIIEEIVSIPEVLGEFNDWIGTIDFFANWRSKGGSIDILIVEGREEEIISTIDEFFSDDPKIDLSNSEIQKQKCSIEIAVLPAMLGLVGALPYLPGVEDAIEEGDIFDLSEVDLGRDFGLLMDGFGCPNGIVEASYQPGE